MNPQEFSKLLRSHAAELSHAYASRWPRIMKVEAINHFHQGFRLGGFINQSLQKWDRTRRQDIPFYGAVAYYEPLNSKSNTLMNSIDGKTEQGAVTMFVASPYAQYHNEGATATVTPRMRKFFWAKDYECKNAHGADDYETQFWKNMALIRKPYITIPQRKFIGASAQLMNTIENKILADIKRILNAN